MVSDHRSPDLICSSDVAYATFSPASRYFLAGGGPGPSSIWEMSSFRRLGTSLDGGFYAAMASFSPDGSRLAIPSGVSHAVVHDVRSGEPIGPAYEHAHWVKQTKFSGDGGRVFTGSRDGTARIFDAFSGDPVAMFTTGNRDGEKTGEVQWIRLGRDESRLVVATKVDLFLGGGPEAIEVWNVEPDRRDVEHLELVARWLAKGMLDDRGGFVELSRDAIRETWDELERLRADATR